MQTPPAGDAGPSPEQAFDQLLSTRDLMGAAIVRALTDMEAIADKHGWDQPGRLFHLARFMAQPGDLPDGADGFVVNATEIGNRIFNGMGGPEIADQIQWVATAGRDLLDRLRGETLAWVLVNEAWGLVADDVPPEEKLLTADERRIKHHPRRVELRFLLAVDPTGRAYQLSHRRDTGQRWVWIDDTDGPRSEGSLPDALRALATA